MKVSIITICRNDVNGLTKTIQSVRQQTFQDFEYLITDGASTDGSIDVIKVNEDIISDWVSEPDQGIYNAMNKSLLRCKGEYVIFMNSGDCFYNSNVLENIFSHSPKADVIYGDVCFKKITYANQHIRTLQDFFCKAPFCHQSAFTKLEKANAFRFQEEYKIVADWIMFVSIFMAGGTFEYVPYIVSKCTEGGVSSDSSKNNQERLCYLTKLYSSKITEDYMELLRLKNGVLWKYYLRLEQTKKLKYYILKILNILHIKSL